MKVMRSITAALCGVAVTSCGGGMYLPAATSLGSSLEEMNTTLSAQLEDYPSQWRSAFLRKASTPAAVQSLDAMRLLCGPVYRTVLAAEQARELGVSSAALTKAAGESPKEFPELLADTLVGQSIGTGDVDPKIAAGNARDQCSQDFSNLDAATDGFLGTSGTESLALLEGLVALWGLLKPVASGILGFVNQQQRSQAIAEYIAENSERLRQNVQSLAAFAEQKAAYERAVAADEFRTTVQTAIQDRAISGDERSEILESGQVYDTLRAQNAALAYKEVDRGIERLENITKGDYTREDLSAAITSLAGSFSALASINENIGKLEKGGEQNEALNAAIAKIRGKKPPKIEPEDVLGDQE
jgi:hypothetical protein